MKNFVPTHTFTRAYNLFGRVIILFMTLLLIASCSRTQISYKFSDWFLLERVDHLFDITRSQEQFLEGKLEHLLVWHRTRELSTIIITLTEFKQRYQDGLDPEDLEWFAEDHHSYFKRFLIKAVPDFSRFLATLTKNQIQHFNIQLEKRNDFLIKQANMTDEELVRDTQKWFIELLEDWFGKLNRGQVENIHTWLEIEKGWVESKLANRRHFQESFISFLQAHKTESEINAQLTMRIEEPETRWTPEFEVQLDKKIAQWKELLLKVDSTITPIQRNQALERIQEYIDDFKTLVI